MKVYAIRNAAGEWYNPRVTYRCWRSKLQEAKLYPKRGSASSAVTNLLDWKRAEDVEVVEFELTEVAGGLWVASRQPGAR